MTNYPRTNEELAEYLKKTRCCDMNLYILDEVIRALRQSQRVPKGWKVMPEQPTPEILDELWLGADKVANLPDSQVPLFCNDVLIDTYRAILAAAPPHPPMEKT